MMASALVGSHRPALVVATTASAALFAWAAWVLPSSPGALPAVLLGVLALAHLVTLFVALLWSPQLRRVWRALSWLSLATGVLLLGMIAVTAREMLARFGNLGVGVAALLGAIAALTLLATVPFASWGLLATRSTRGPG